LNDLNNGIEVIDTGIKTVRYRKRVGRSWIAAIKSGIECVDSGNACATDGIA